MFIITISRYISCVPSGLKAIHLHRCYNCLHHIRSRSELNDSGQNHTCAQEIIGSDSMSTTEVSHFTCIRISNQEAF